MYHARKKQQYRGSSLLVLANDQSWPLLMCFKEAVVGDFEDVDPG